MELSDEWKPCQHPDYNLMRDLNRNHPAKLLLDPKPPEITCDVTDNTPVLFSVTEFEVICCTAREDEQTT